MKTNRNVIIFMLISSLFLVISACANHETYKDDVQITQIKLITVASQAEEMLNLYSEVWSVSIESDSKIKAEVLADKADVSLSELRDYFTLDDAGTRNPYMGREGNWYIDEEPEVVIGGLKALYTDTGRIALLKETLIDIKEDIQGLNNPPDKYEKAFDKLLEMYSLTEELASLAISPSGSFVSFNEKRGQLSDDIVKLNKEIEVLLPE